MIVLEKFESEQDIKRLIKWVDSNKLNIIWASRRFNFPLNKKQLHSHIELAPKNKILIFKVIYKTENIANVVGHAELDLLGSEVKISRLIISKEQRGKGYGEKMINALINYINTNLKFKDICLTVFTFNKPAITLYEKIGFETIEIDKAFMTFEGETWDRQKMVLKK